MFINLQQQQLCECVVLTPPVVPTDADEDNVDWQNAEHHEERIAIITDIDYDYEQEQGEQEEEQRLEYNDDSENAPEFKPSSEQKKQQQPTQVGYMKNNEETLSTSNPRLQRRWMPLSILLFSVLIVIGMTVGTLFERNRAAIPNSDTQMLSTTKTVSLRSRRSEIVSTSSDNGNNISTIERVETVEEEDDYLEFVQVMRERNLRLFGIDSVRNSTEQDNRNLLALPKKVVCPVYPPPPPLPGKKGMAFTLRPSGYKGSWEENLPKIRSMDASWNYNWSPNRIPQQPKNLEYIPMTWSGVETSAALKIKLKTVVEPQIRHGVTKRLLGFNEPDHPDQSAMSVYKALSRWAALESLNIPLVSPSCAHPEREWMQHFMGNATELCMRVDYIGVHWYSAPDVPTFQKYMLDLYTKYRRPLVITEFAIADWNAKQTSQNRYSEERVLNFMKQAIPWLEKTEYIAGYAWYSFPHTSAVGWTSALFYANGHITPVGMYYKSVRSNKRMGDQSITVYK